MEIAWEALEVARKIYEQQQNPEYDLQLSEVIIFLIKYFI